MEVIITGGDSARVKTESYVLGSGGSAWIERAGLPGGMYDGATVQLGDTFVVVGGEDQGKSALDTVWEFVPENYSWRPARRGWRARGRRPRSWA